MYRVSVNFTRLDFLAEEQTLIVKIFPGGLQKDMLESIGGLFETEIQMYNNVIPAFEKLLKITGDNTVIGGKCIYSSLTPEKVLVFEDLTKLNYKPITNWGGNWMIAEKAAEKLAKWHAVSFKMLSEGHSGLHKFSEHLYSGEVFKMIPLYKDGFQDFLEMMKSHSEFAEYVQNFTRIVARQPLLKTQKLFKSGFNELPANIYVLNHGDFHIKNVMFLENDMGEIEDLKLVDFQLCVIGPAVIDLIYMLYMFLDDKDRLERRENMIKFYFNTFLKTLKSLNFTGKLPKMVDLKKDFLLFKEYELMIAVTMLPLITKLQGSTFVEPSQLGTNEFRKYLYKNPQYLEYMKKAMPQFLKMGLLD
ncbi:hypothetical protein ACFFRR_000188 [Megaselia abdita]